MSQQNGISLLRKYTFQLFDQMRKWIQRDIIAIILLAIAAIVIMYPVIKEPRSRILGPEGDNIHYVYMTGWAAQSLLLRASPFIDPRLNYPDKLALSANDAPFLSMIIASPAVWVFGPIFGYNLVIFLSHFLSGYFTYLWITKITGSRISGFFAGLSFMITPYRVLRSLGQPNMVSTQMIPLFFWSLDNALCSFLLQDNRSENLDNKINTYSPILSHEVRLWMLGIATFLVASMSQYYLVICLVTGAFYVIIIIATRFTRTIIYGWRIIVAIGFGALIGALPYISILGAGNFEAYNIARTRTWSADPINFLLPSGNHPLWGAFINNLRPEPLSGEKTLYIGIVTGLLAIFALLYRRNPYRRIVIVWIGTALAGAIFALGTDLYINNQPVQRDHPFWLPAYYLAHIPLLNIMRVWSRFGIITIFFIALLSGIGVAVLVHRYHRWRWLIFTFLTALLIIDFLPGKLESTVLAPRKIDLWLAQQPGDFAVAFLPVDKPFVNDKAIFGSLFHGKHLPAFIHPNHLPTAYREFFDIAIDFPDPYTIQALKRKHLKYLVLEKEQFNGWRAPDWSIINSTLSTSPQLKVVAEIDGFVVVTFK